MAKPAKNTICLWYDRDAEEAARFYASDVPRFVRRARCTARRATFRRGRRATC